MDRVYFDMGVFTFWSEESLDNKRLIAKGGVLVSDDAALKEVMDGSDPLDMDLVEMLTNLSEDGFELNICDTLSVPEIQDLLGELGIGDFFSNIVSAKSARNFHEADGCISRMLFVGQPKNAPAAAAVTASAIARFTHLLVFCTFISRSPRL